MGFSHIIVPAVVVVGVGIIGTYMLVASHAATTCKANTYGSGASSTCVKYIQRFYNGAGYQYWKWSGNALLTVDGKYGTQTKTQTAAFQKFSGLTQDGVVGPKTWSILCADAGAIKNNKLQAYPKIYDAYLAAKSAGCAI